MNFWNLLTAPTELATEATEAAEAVLSFEPVNFVKNLEYMGIGMLTIFIIIGVIILATVLINKVFSRK